MCISKQNSILYLCFFLFTNILARTPFENLQEYNTKHRSKVVFNESDNSVTVIGSHVFVMNLLLVAENIDAILGFDSKQPIVPRGYGIKVKNVANSTHLKSPQTHVPTQKDGAVLEVFFIDKTRKSHNSNHLFYGVFAMQNVDYYQSGYWKVPSKKFKNAVYSNDLRVSLLSQKLRKSNFFSQEEQEIVYPVSVKLTVKNCTLTSLSIPALGEFSFLELLKIYERKEYNDFKTLLQYPDQFDYTFVVAEGGLWGEKQGKNTLTAFENAIAVGADILQVDVRLTADNFIVACSGTYLERWYDVADLTQQKGIPPEMLKINHITKDEFLALQVKNKNGKILNNIYPCTLEEIFDRFPLRLLQLNYFDDRFQINGIAKDMNTIQLQQIMKAQHFLMYYIKNTGIENVLTMQIPLQEFLGGNFFTPQGYISQLNAFNATNYTVSDFTPYCVLDENLYRSNYATYLEWVSVANRIENNFKYDNDSLLDNDLVNLLSLFNVGIYSLYADHPEGRSYTDSYGNHKIFSYQPDRAYLKPLAADLGSFIDNRGNLDWLMEKGMINSITTPRPDMVVKFLESLGQRNRIDSYGIARD